MEDMTSERPTMSLTYPSEPFQTSATVFVTWASDGARWVAFRYKGDDQWFVAGQNSPFSRTWDELTRFVAQYELDPQAVLDTVRVLNLEPPAVLTPVIPRHTGRLVLAQYGETYAVRSADSVFWDTTAGHEGITWGALMAHVFETTGYAAWRILS